MQLQCVACWVIAIILLCESTTAKPDPDQVVAMADAVKILQNLDRYYSQVARPSSRSSSGGPQRRADLEKALSLLQLQELDRMYSQRSRPRFGKRAELQQAQDDISVSDGGSVNLWRSLVRRR